MIDSAFDLTGRTALVTGASSGFGSHFVKVLTARGANVVAAARRKDRLDALVDEVVADGGKAVAADVDVTDVAAVSSMFDVAGTASMSWVR